VVCVQGEERRQESRQEGAATGFVITQQARQDAGCRRGMARIPMA